jgi:hypothetical protein
MQYTEITVAEGLRLAPRDPAYYVPRTKQGSRNDREPERSISSWQTGVLPAIENRAPSSGPGSDRYHSLLSDYTLPEAAYRYDESIIILLLAISAEDDIS